MVILLTIAGTLLTIAGLFGLKLCYIMYKNLLMNTQVVQECHEIVEAFYQQQQQAMQMMGMEPEEENASFGLNQE